MLKQGLWHPWPDRSRGISNCLHNFGSAEIVKTVAMKPATSVCSRHCFATVGRKGTSGTCATHFQKSPTLVQHPYHRQCGGLHTRPGTSSAPPPLPGGVSSYCRGRDWSSNEYCWAPPAEGIGGPLPPAPAITQDSHPCCCEAPGESTMLGDGGYEHHPSACVLCRGNAASLPIRSLESPTTITQLPSHGSL